MVGVNVTMHGHAWFILRVSPPPRFATKLAWEWLDNTNMAAMMAGSSLHNNMTCQHNITVIMVGWSMTHQYLRNQKGEIQLPHGMLPGRHHLFLLHSRLGCKWEHLGCQVSKHCACCVVRRVRAAGPSSKVLKMQQQRSTFHPSADASFALAVGSSHSASNMVKECAAAARAWSDSVDPELTSDSEPASSCWLHSLGTWQVQFIRDVSSAELSQARTCAKAAVGLLDLVAANYSANQGRKHNALQCHQCAEPAQVISTASKAHSLEFWILSAELTAMTSLNFDARDQVSSQTSAWRFWLHKV